MKRGYRARATYMQMHAMIMCSAVFCCCCCARLPFVNAPHHTLGNTLDCCCVTRQHYLWTLPDDVSMKDECTAVCVLGHERKIAFASFRDHTSLGAKRGSQRSQLIQVLEVATAPAAVEHHANIMSDSHCIYL